MKIYTTQELIEILKVERESIVRTGKSKLSAPEGDWHPGMKAVLKDKGLNEIESYHAFREQIWNYQAMHGVSGIVWENIEFLGHTFRYPDVNDQLLTLPEDLELMKGYKTKVLDYWHRVTEGMELYVAVGGDDDNCIRTAREVVNNLSSRCEWATVNTYRIGEWLEIQLWLGWGDPTAAAFVWGQPESGSELVIAYPPNK